MQILRLNDVSVQVAQWQRFLASQGFTQVKADGQFGPLTRKATQEFQRRCGLIADGIVGKSTYQQAQHIGQFLQAGPSQAEARDWPARPAFGAITAARRKDLFGAFDWEPLGESAIQIKGKWQQENIIKVHIPQLNGIRQAPASGNIWFHRKGVEQIRGLFRAWEKEGLLSLIHSWDGSFVPRFSRKSHTLSCHAFGIAFDINATTNGFEVSPPLIDQPGSVRALVPLAHQYGFYWGGHFKNRPDGMHFELARVH